MSSEPPNCQKTRGFFERLSAAFHDESIDHVDQVHVVLREALDHNVIGKDTWSMMEGALNVSHLRADDLMIPRAQVKAIDLSNDLEDMVRVVIETGHSRFPAVEDDLDNVKGLLHAKDLLRLINEPNLDMNKLLRPVRYVPESQPINVLLRDFKRTHSHMALVIDEFGGVSGLITIEDVIEQIVGEIYDEYDHEDVPAIVQEGPNRWRMDAHVAIEEFNEKFGSRLEDQYCETMGGLVTDRLERVPAVGETWEEQGLRFTVARSDERQIHVLKVERLDKSAGE